MITKTQATDVICGEAYDLAKCFVENYLPPDADLTENYHGQIKYSPILGALANFVTDVSGTQIGLMEFDPEGFASWLYADDFGLNIVLDPRQMQIWAQQNALPIHTQRLRCVIHELGHIFLSNIVPSAQPPTKYGIQAQSVPEREEEKAWAFTFMFLAVLLGDYSYRRRVKNKDDNTVAVHV